MSKTFRYMVEATIKNGKVSWDIDVEALSTDEMMYDSDTLGYRRPTQEEFEEDQELYGQLKVALKRLEKTYAVNLTTANK